ncbi:MAG: AAA family ATPase [Armatimonadota bacterium]|nr:AAA family ATPase [Armatimonadota bacterium]MDR7469664.1 AAA family ATPase [Armatimonadota bacterium]MDR7474905.1 AAA family ATPase [Armatimonadota bacterium]MDR7538383.1 AAA family ATPase [Armatimonadota bacterium]
MAEQTSDARQRLRLPADALRWRCDPAQFTFETTAELQPGEIIVGQERAVRALDFGLSVPQPAYNIFVTGPVGTGRTTYTHKTVRDLAATRPTPPDWVYVYNYQMPDQPMAISLPPGWGQRFRRDMDELVEELKDGIRKVLASEHFAARRSEALRSYEGRINELWQILEAKARRLGFGLERTPVGVVPVAIGPSGEPLSPEVLERLPPEQREELQGRARALQEDIGEALRQVRNLEREARETLRTLEGDAVASVAHRAVEPLKERYADHPRVVQHLEALLRDVVEHRDDFKEEEEPPRLPFPVPVPLGRRDAFARYRVNLLVDNSQTRGAPVVIEANPTYYNLVGKVEYRGEFGAFVTDFTMIKPGALHRANGGFLILQLNDVLMAPLSWEALKRALKSREIRIENIGEQLGLIPTATLRPEPIPLQVKVVIIGSSLLYHLLYILDDDFRKLFKIKADFDVDMPQSAQTLQQYALAICAICRRDGLLPFHRDAVARVLEYSARLAEDQEKLSARFNEMSELIYEGAAWAQREHSPVVRAEHVQKALEEKIFRSNRLEERIREAIQRGQLLVDIDGQKVGQVNGLAVHTLGDYTFGRPNRITARAFVGSRGVVNIEREAQLSGRIHTKGVYILSGYLAGKYAQDRPLSLSATLTFEQSYDEVEGDSASSTELYTLLSELSGAPIDQGIAVTGSVNQRGEIQPIGGVNEKIEGFYYVCKAVGLTGRQGVIIPRQNVRNLMLRDEVVEAVREGRFHIWAVGTVEEGLEILTGLTAGEADAEGRYPEGTINGRVARRLEALAERLRRFMPLRAREDGGAAAEAAEAPSAPPPASEEE